MPKLAANLSLLFDEVPFVQRFELAARAGFAAVECQFPYPFPPGQLAEELQRNRLALVLFNLPAGNWEAGDRGLAILPERVEEFRAGVAQAIELAHRLGCAQLNCLAGVAPADADPARLHATLVANLRHAAGRLQAAGLRLLVEPLNRYDVPGFYLHRTAQAVALVEEVGAPNLFVQYDAYHAQRSEGELAGTLATHLARIGHVQIADNPGRHEPGTGEINYRYLLRRLDELGYAGWVGCEYRPRAGTAAGLAWRAAHGLG